MHGLVDLVHLVVIHHLASTESAHWGYNCLQCTVWCGVVCSAWWCGHRVGVALGVVVVGHALAIDLAVVVMEQLHHLPALHIIPLPCSTGCGGHCLCSTGGGRHCRRPCERATTSCPEGQMLTRRSLWKPSRYSSHETAWSLFLSMDSISACTTAVVSTVRAHRRVCGHGWQQCCCWHGSCGLVDSRLWGIGSCVVHLGGVRAGVEGVLVLVALEELEGVHAQVLVGLVDAMPAATVESHHLTVGSSTVCEDEALCT